MASLMVYVSKTDANSVQVSWAYPTNPSTGWRVERDGIDMNNSGPWGTNLSGNIYQQPFTNLVATSAYTFTVTNLDNPSIKVSKSFDMATGSANVITGFSKTAATDTSITLEWSYTGDTLSSYTLSYGSTTRTIDASLVSYTDTDGLTAGTSRSYTLVGNLAAGGTTNNVQASGMTTGGVTTGAWLSGASVNQVEGFTSTSSPFGSWRGTPLACASTWADDKTNISIMRSCPQFDPGGTYYNWDTNIDIALGPFQNGQDWSMAAAGNGTVMDNWTTALNNLKAKWNRIPRGTCYIRFAHEMNGDWYPWAVYPGQQANFISGWRRFRQMQLSIFPEAKLVLCTNGNTYPHNYDWRTFWPGDDYVDVYATDFYVWHYGNSPYDSYGGPAHLSTHREFAQAHGKAIAIPEWGTASDRGGDRPEYIRYIHDFGVQYGGTGAGNLLYENYFNVDKPGDALCQLYPTTTNPSSAPVYRDLF